MAVVGSAEIVVRAITDQVKKDIQKAFKDLRPMLATEGKKAGKGFADSFNESAKQRLGDGFGDSLRDSLTDATKEATKDIPDLIDGVKDEIDEKMEEAGRSGGNSFGKGFLRSKFANSAIAASKAFTTVFAVGNIAGAGISSLVGVLSALVSSLFAVAASASQAAGALGVLPGIYTSIAQAAGVTKLAMSGVGDAFKAGVEAAAATGKEAEAAMLKYEQALAKLSPAARSFVEYLVSVKDQFKDIKVAAQEGLFPGLEDALRKIVGGNFIEVVANGFGRTAELVGEAAKGVAQMFALGSQNNLGKFLEANNRIISIFVTRGGDGENVLTKLVRLFIRLRLAVQPVTERFAVWIASLIRGAAWATNTAKEVDNLAKFFNKAGDRAALLGDIGKNLIGIFVGLGKAASPSGTGLLKSFRAYTRELAKTVNVKQENLREYFANVADTLRAVANLTRAIGRGLADLGDNEGLQGFVTGLEPAVESLTNVGNAMASAGPDLAKFISQIAEILEAFADTEALQLFFDILNSVLGVIIDFIKTDFGGWLLATVGTIAAVTRAIGLMRSVAVLAFKILIGGAIGTARSFDALTASVARTRVALTQSQAYATATTRMGRLGAAATIASAKMRMLASSALKFAGPMAGFALVTTEATKGIFGVNAAAGALIGAMAGPWGAAIGGAIGLGVDFAKSNNGVFDSLESVRTALSEGVGIDKLHDQLAQARADVDAFKANIDDAWSAGGEQQGFFDSLSSGAAALKNSAEGLFGDSDVEEAEAQLKELTEQTEKYSAAVREANQHARAFANGFSDRIKAVGLTAFGATESMRDLGRAINYQQDQARRALDAEYALAASMADVKRRLKDGEKGFKANTEVGRENYQLLLSVADALNRGEGSYRANKKQLRETARAMGATKEETKEFVLALLKVPKGRKINYSVQFDKFKLNQLLDSFKELPEEVKQKIKQEGIPQSIEEINKLVKKYDLAEKDRETLVKLKDQASDKIADIRHKLEQLDGTTATAFVNILTNTMPSDREGASHRPGRDRVPQAPRQESPNDDELNGPGGPGRRERDRSAGAEERRGGTIIQIDKVEAHDYKDFMSQLERRRQRRGLGGLG